MSYYIQDNMKVAKSSDGLSILFIKGGDNNLIGEDGKHVSNWFMADVFISQKDYEDFLEKLIFSSISSGGHKLASHMKKNFNHFFEQESAVYKRFLSAFKNPIKINLPLNNMSEKTLIDFNMELKRQSKEPLTIIKRLYKEEEKEYSSDKEKAIKTTNQRIKEKKSLEKTKIITNYNESVLKITEKMPIEEIVLSEKVCKAFYDVTNNLKKSYDTGFDLLEDISLKRAKLISHIPYKNFKYLLLNKSSMKRLLNYPYKLKDFLNNYPVHMKILLEDKDYQQMLIEAQVNSGKYDREQIEEDVEIIKAFDYNLAISKQSIKVDKKEETNEFLIKCSTITRSAFFTNTDKTYPELIKEIIYLFKYAGIDKEYIKENQKINLEHLIYCFNHQKGKTGKPKQKNKEAIKKYTEVLLNELTEIIEENSLKVLSAAFDFNIKSKKIKKKKIDNHKC